MPNRTWSKWVLTSVALLAAAGAAGLASASNMTSAARLLGTAATGLTASSGNIAEVAQSAGQFNTLLAAAKAAGLADALVGPGPFTVFAPTDEAFAALGQNTINDLLKPENKAKLAGILTYHIVPARVPAAEAIKLSAAPTLNGQRLRVSVDNAQLRLDEARVIKTDIAASNGVIHVIDRVLLPVDRDIVQQAQKNHFNTLLAAAKAAGLVDTLKSDGPLTVFAPTDEAFAKLGDDAIKSLLKPENRAKLTSILAYHVVSKRLFSDDALKAGSAQTVQGENLAFTLADGSLRVNNARILRTDIDASNGVIHVIDSVLIPANPAAGSTDNKMSLGMIDTSPAGLIERAIERGVPLFNNGQPAACAAIYEITTLALLAMDNSRVATDARKALQSALERAATQPDPAEQAWTLRRGLDSALNTMSR
jgi:transforming growth factor-beta-induced protein